MRALRVIAAVLAGSLAACTSESLEFADWTIPVPVGTPIIELAHVPDEERTEIVRIERDLVLTEAFGKRLYRPTDLDVAPDGNIFVLDSGNNRVVVFDNEGTPLHFFGQEGQGPGEFEGPWQLCLTTDRALVYDVRNRRLSVFDFGGELRSDQHLPGRPPMSEMQAVGSDLLLTDHPGRSIPPFPAPWVVGRYSPEGEPVVQFVKIETGGGSYWSVDDAGGSIPMREPFPVGAFSKDGTAYVASGQEYQVLAFSPEGTMSWALRTDYEVPIPSREDKDAVLEAIGAVPDGRLEGLTSANILWPDRYAAIEGLEVDGHANLYVFTHAARSPEDYWESTGPVPVDVYSASGERLFSGMISIDSWNAAHADHLYRIETNPETEERVVARYRLVEPF